MTTPEPRPDWVSVRAIAWVLDDAPCPADLLPVLTAIARRCDEHGKGSYQSAQTIGEKTGKSEAQVRRDIANLRKLGLVKSGDAAKPAHLPAGKRPAVYDLPLDLKGPKPIKESRNVTGKRKPDLTPSIHATPSTGATPSIHATPTPRMDATPTPSTHAYQTRPLNNPLEKPSSLSPREADQPAAAEDRERDQIDDPQEPEPETIYDRFFAQHDITDPDRVGHLTYGADHHLPGGSKGIGWWKKCARQGDLPDVIAEIDRLTPSRPAVEDTRPHRDAHLYDVDPTGKFCQRCFRGPDAPDHDVHLYEPEPKGGYHCQKCGFAEAHAQHVPAPTNVWDFDAYDRRRGRPPAVSYANGRRHQPFQNPPAADYDLPL